MTLSYAPAIRSRLMLLVLACMIPALVLAVILISHDYQIGRKNFIQSAMATARANALEVDKEFATVESALTALSTSPSFATGDWKALHAQASVLSAKQNIFNIVIENERGQQLMNSYALPGQALPSDPDDIAVQAVRSSRQRYISNFFTGPLSKSKIVSVGLPLVHSGDQFAVLTGTLAVTRFGEILHHQNYPVPWVISILDRNGILVARSADMQRYVGSSAIPAVLKRMREHPEGAFETFTLDGKPILAVLARAQDSGWTVAIGIPLDVLRAETVGKIWLLVFVTAATLGVGLFVAWRIGTAIQGAMEGLIPPALALGAGRQVGPADYGLREANEVGMALSKASAMLHAATHQANHDVLTGLANRAMLHAFLDRQLELCSRMGTSLSILYLDLDGFKSVNDTHGHAAGDALLQQAAGRLLSRLRKADMAARLGGDEFAVVIVDSDSGQTASVLAMLETVMAQPYAIGDLSLSAAASIGFASYPAHGKTSADLLAAADQSMYDKKSCRKHANHPADKQTRI